MDSVFFILSKVLRFSLSPATWLLLLPLVAQMLIWRKQLVLGRLLWIVEITLVLLIGFYPVGLWLAYPLEHYAQQPELSAEPPDGVIVLGGAWLPQVSSYWQHWELNFAAERELALITLARRYPEAKLVFTGGSGGLFNTHLKEADVAETLYRDLGIDPDRVIFERDSRNTYENAKFSKLLMLPNADERWWLITSAYHMPRSVGVFCRVGWSVTPYPVDHFYHSLTWKPAWAFADHLWELEKITYEWFGLVIYRLTGKSTALFPQGC